MVDNWTKTRMQYETLRATNTNIFEDKLYADEKKNYKELSTGNGRI